MARGKAQSNEKKAQVIAALLAGGAVADVARQYAVPESTVRSWAKGAKVSFAELRAEKKKNLEEMIADYLAANLAALTAQCREASKPEFISKQNAQDLGMLHGIMADKSLRIIEAAAAAQPEER